MRKLGFVSCCHYTSNLLQPTGPNIMALNANLKSIVDFSKGNGLVTAIAQDAETGEILMVANMNEESLARTVETGEAVYWSRSRHRLWHKGEESGNVQKVRELYVDCDGDAILMKIEQIGDAACHTGKRSCFFRRVDGDEIADVGVQVFDPREVYKK
jgi:phosphoribosyl-AMP cyclohydrolase